MPITTLDSQRVTSRFAGAGLVLWIRRSVSTALGLACLVSLTACSDASRRELDEFAHSPGVSALADLGRQVIATATTAIDEAQQLPGHPEIPKQVSRAGDVGHRDFASAKQVLPRIYTGALHEEFYCGCDYQDKTVRFQSCGYVPRQNPERASRIEWEHIVPAWNLGHQRQCWQQGGRKACQAEDQVFRLAEGDLNNIVPAVGEVNGDRSNFAFGAWSRQPRLMYGKCQTVVDFEIKRAQPRPEVRGRIARVYFYMHERYQLRMSRQDQQLMCAWAKTYPIDAWEQERDRRIARLQGNGNLYVTEPGRSAQQCS